jgi:hypothetical protein
MPLRNALTLVVFLAFVLFLSACSDEQTPPPGETARAPEMPPHWEVTSDFLVPADQLRTMRQKLGADISSVRNTIYDVKGQRVQINVIVAPDAVNAEKVMKKLRSMKSEEALLRRDLTIYEFVGENDVLPLIAEGRNHIETK